MERPEFESRVAAALDAIQRGSRVESSVIELKAAWPEASDAARQICGFCNSGLGSPVILIIGADERSGTFPGVDERDLDSWYRSLEKWFGEGAPRLIQDMTAERDGRSVRALLFDTSNRPYSFRLPDSNGRPGEFLEYPIRRATGTRSALRDDLRELASRLVATPRIELIEGRITDRLSEASKSIDLRLGVLCEPVGPGPVTVSPNRLDVELWAAVHQCKAGLDWAAQGAHRIEPTNVELKTPGKAKGDYVRMRAESSDVPFTLDLLAQVRGPYLTTESIQRFGVRVIVRGTTGERPAVAQGLFYTFNRIVWDLERP
jgi:hypothetical protein